MESFCEQTIQILCRFVEDAVIFIDDASCECLHWSGGFKKLLEAGALDVRDIKHTKECLESEAKAVFVVSTPLLGQVSNYVKRIVKSSDFSQCIVISTISSEANDFIVRGQNFPAFEYYTRQLKLWIQNELASVQIVHLPLFACNLTPNVFITSPNSNLFPVLPSDVARLQRFLHSKGDKRMFNNLGDVDFNFLPHNIQCNIKMLTSSMTTMFEAMQINEDCYSVGHFSRLVANDLANMPDPKGRRKAATKRASVVFMDRTLDLVAPISHTSDSVFGTIYEILPRLKNHNNDVAVDMSSLFAPGNITNETLFPGSLAHYGDEEVQKLFTYFIRKTRKECLSYICERVEAFLKKESITIVEPDESSKYNINRLKTLLELIRNNQSILKKYRGFLQCSMALLNALSDEENEHLDELLSAEKGILLEMGEENTSPFTQVMNMLTNSSKQRFSVVDALMFCLFIYSAENEVSNLSPGDEETIKEVMINLLMDGSHKEDLLFLLGDLDSSERQIRTRIADVFERLRVISQARREMKKLTNVIGRDSMGVVRYEALVKQIIEQIFDGTKSELEDVEFRSHGIKDFLKTGFGFFMNVTKPRPDDHPLLILYVIGGITWHEVKTIQETLEKTKPNTQVLIGSTRIITPSEILEQVLCTENLFVDVDT